MNNVCVEQNINLSEDNWNCLNVIEILELSAPIPGPERVIIEIYNRFIVATSDANGAIIARFGEPEW